MSKKSQKKKGKKKPNQASLPTKSAPLEKENKKTKQATAPRKKSGRKEKKSRGSKENPFDVQGSALSDKVTQLMLAVFTLLCLIVYVLTLNPTIPGGDSSELISVAYTLGIAHPPGYPLYTMLAKLFSFIPYGTVAWRINFFSAVCSTGAAVFIFLTVVVWTKNRWAGLFAGGLFAFSPLIWRYAIVAEVFSLNNFFVALLLFLSVSYAKSGDKKYAYWGAFFLGLGLTNHQTLLFYGFPLVIYILAIGGKDLFQKKSFGILLGAFALGFSPYLYLPIASGQIPLIAWGDQSSLSGLIRHVLRQEYGTFQLFSSEDQASLFKALSYYFAYLPAELLYGGLLLAIGGIWSSLRKEGGLGFGLWSGFAFSFYMIIFHIMANLPLDSKLHFDVHTRFWQQANLIVCVWAGAGLAVFAFRFAKQKIAISAFIAIAALVLQIGLHYQEEDQSQNRSFEQMARAALKHLPPDAILLVAGDIMTNPTRYLQQCEGLRKDVKIIDREMLKAPWYKRIIQKHYPDVILPGKAYGPKDQGGFNLKEFFDANREKHLIFVNELSQDGSFEKDDKSWKKEYEARPYGFVDQIVQKSEPLNLRFFIKQSRVGFKEFDYSKIKGAQKGSWEKIVKNVYWDVDHRRARFLLEYAIRTNNPENVLRAALNILIKLHKLHPEPTPAMLKNIGLLHYNLYKYHQVPGALANSVKYWRRYVIDPMPTDKEVGKMRVFLQRYDLRQKQKKANRARPGSGPRGTFKIPPQPNRPGIQIMPQPHHPNIQLMPHSSGQRLRLPKQQRPPNPQGHPNMPPPPLQIQQGSPPKGFHPGMKIIPVNPPKQRHRPGIKIIPTKPQPASRPS